MRCYFDTWRKEAGRKREATVRLSEGHFMVTELYSGRCPPLPFMPSHCRLQSQAGPWCCVWRLFTWVGTGPPPKSTQAMLTHRRDWFPVTTDPGLIGKPPIFLHFNDRVLFILIYFSLTNHSGDQIVWCWLLADIISNYWKITQKYIITSCTNNTQSQIYKLYNHKLHK